MAASLYLDGFSLILLDFDAEVTTNRSLEARVLRVLDWERKYLRTITTRYVGDRSRLEKIVRKRYDGMITILTRVLIITEMEEVVNDLLYTMEILEEDGEDWYYKRASYLSDKLWRRILREM
jgi:hypothetical protein